MQAEQRITFFLTFFPVSALQTTQHPPFPDTGSGKWLVPSNRDAGGAELILNLCFLVGGSSRGELSFSSFLHLFLLKDQVFVASLLRSQLSID